MSQHLNFVLESIDHQTRDKFDYLTKLVSEVDPTKEGNLKPIEKFFYSEYGIRTSVELTLNPNSYSAYVLALPMTSKNAFWDQNFIDMMESAGDDLLADDYVEVFIDLKNAKIKMKDSMTDRFSIHLTSAMFDGSFEHDQIAAALLHELGHIFNTLVQVVNLHISNQIVSSLINKNTNIHYVLTRDESSPEIERISTEIIASKVGHVRRSLHTKYYDGRLNEMMADHFVTRHGGGLAIARLAVNPKMSWHYYMTNSLAFNTKMSLGIIVATAVGGMLAGATVAGGLMAGLILMTLLSPLAGDGIGSDYETLPNRVKSIRTDTISYLAKNKVTQKERKRILDDIDELDKMIKQLPKSILNLNLFAPGKYLFDLMSGKTNNLKLHKKIEALVNNDLFVAGSRFAVLN